MLFLFKPDAARRLSIAPDLEEDLPGGCVEAGESWQEALVREVREETGTTSFSSRSAAFLHEISSYKRLEETELTNRDIPSI